MIRQIIMRMTIAVLFMVSSVVLISQVQEEEMQKLYQEYQEVNQQLELIQAQAFQDPEVSELAEGFSDYIEEKMVEMNPEAEKLMSDRDAMIQEIQVAQMEDDQEKAQELQQNYQQINGQIQGIQQQVFQNPDVIERQQEIENIVINKMIEIEPETEILLERIQEISTEFEKLMQQE